MQKIKQYVKLYSYVISYHKNDKIYIASCAEFPSLLAHGKTEQLALKEIKKVVTETLKWIDNDLEE
jgi:predicted RNase H-like HicB family nuclease